MLVNLHRPISISSLITSSNTLSRYHIKLAEQANGNAIQAQVDGAVYPITSNRLQQLRFFTMLCINVFEVSFNYIINKVLFCKGTVKSYLLYKILVHATKNQRH